MGMTVDWVADGLRAEQAMQTDDFDVVILDLGLPRQDGRTTLMKVRQGGNRVPVLILTARDSVMDRVDGLDVGADDYLVKPFDLDELAARLRALTRRREGRAAPALIHGEIELDPAARTVALSGAAVNCTSHELAILQALLENRGRVLSKQRLEESLYGWSEGVESNAIEVHISHLRKKLGKELIRTIRGVGYTIPK